MRSLKPFQGKLVSMCATTSSCDCELYRTDRKHRTKEDDLF